MGNDATPGRTAAGDPRTSTATTTLAEGIGLLQEAR